MQIVRVKSALFIVDAVYLRSSPAVCSLTPEVQEAHARHPAAVAVSAEPPTVAFDLINRALKGCITTENCAPFSESWTAPQRYVRIIDHTSPSAEIMQQRRVQSSYRTMYHLKFRQARRAGKQELNHRKNDRCTQSGSDHGTHLIVWTGTSCPALEMNAALALHFSLVRMFCNGRIPAEIAIQASTVQS